ncbi:MAG: hypothetical protein COA94_08300 [Rickettsiales bacterium]|nr:MAG: hypothetical protein COA94_08300 [Rickettsiales bacterium]
MESKSENFRKNAVGFMYKFFGVFDKTEFRLHSVMNAEDNTTRFLENLDKSHNKHYSKRYKGGSPKK